PRGRGRIPTHRSSSPEPSPSTPRRCATPGTGGALDASPPGPRGRSAPTGTATTSRAGRSDRRGGANPGRGPDRSVRGPGGPLLQAGRVDGRLGPAVHAHLGQEVGHVVLD